MIIDLISHDIHVYTCMLCKNRMYVCVQVLVGHSKAEVFEMVRDLDLPLEQGNVQLLKKLQALGLHANRFICTYTVLVTSSLHSM